MSWYKNIFQSIVNKLPALHQNIFLTVVATNRGRFAQSLSISNFWTTRTSCFGILFSNNTPPVRTLQSNHSQSGIFKLKKTFLLMNAKQHQRLTHHRPFKLRKIFRNMLHKLHAKFFRIGKMFCMGSGRYNTKGKKNSGKKKIQVKIICVISSQKTVEHIKSSYHLHLLCCKVTPLPNVVLPSKNRSG